METYEIIKKSLNIYNKVLSGHIFIYYIMNVMSVLRMAKLNKKYKLHPFASRKGNAHIDSYHRNLFMWKRNI